MQNEPNFQVAPGRDIEAGRAIAPGLGAKQPGTGKRPVGAENCARTNPIVGCNLIAYRA